MLTLLKNLNCFAPESLGERDILIVKDTVYKISPPGGLSGYEGLAKVIDCTGLFAFPGFIDSHVHFIGGGGESGPLSRIGEISAQEIIAAGVTTAVGLLGADRHTKTLSSLLAKARELELLGITTYIYTGSYEIPAVTFTGCITTDLLLVDKVIGVGETAISDFRASHAGIDQLLKLASAAHMGGMLSAKAGLVHLHMGDGKQGLDILNELLEKSDLRKSIFLPTHINRNITLFNQGVEYAQKGGNIDLTSGEKIGLSVPEALRRLNGHKVNLERVTVSSDGNAGSAQGKCDILSLHKDITDCLKQGFDITATISLVTANVAKRLKLYPKKGVIAKGSDADLILTDKEYNLQAVFCMGRHVFAKTKN